MTNPITPEALARLAELDKAASPAPWHTDGSGLYGAVRIENEGKILTKQCIDTTLSWEQEELDDSDFSELEPLHPNALLVKEARNAVPALLAEIERLHAELETAREEAWEACADKAYELYLSEEQRDELHAANPYREESA